MKHILEESLATNFKISPDYMAPIITLLQKFELAIPLNMDTILIPSFLLIKGPKRLFSLEQYNFPRNKFAVDFEDISALQCRTDEIQYSNVEFVYIDLCSTGMCFRRLFFAHHIPASIWPKLIARFLLSTEQNSFHKIICDNCVPHIPYKLTSAGDALIGSLLCRWSYGRNYIELSLGEHSILRVNALFNKEDNKIVSVTRNKLKNMLVYKQDDKIVEEMMQQQEGFEVNIPDYTIISRPEGNNKVHSSDLMSMQMLSHVLEIIDEVLKDWFEGLSERGIYSDSYLTHIIPCPFCCGDLKVEKTCHGCGDNSNGILQNKTGSSVAFSIQYLLQKTRASSNIVCPQHGVLEIDCLAPDVVRYNINTS